MRRHHQQKGTPLRRVSSYLQLFLVKGLEQVLRNHLVEAFLQGQELGLDAVQEPPVHIQPADAETELCFIFLSP